MNSDDSWIVWVAGQPIATATVLQCPANTMAEVVAALPPVRVDS